MEKTILIDGQEVKLKSTAACLRMYKMQFRRDLIKDIFKLKNMEKYIEDGKVVANDKIMAEIDFDIFLDLLWVFAKKADPTIPNPLEWEDKFESMPFKDIFPPVLELLMILLDGAKKK